MLRVAVGGFTQVSGGANQARPRFPRRVDFASNPTLKESLRACAFSSQYCTLLSSLFECDGIPHCPYRSDGYAYDESRSCLYHNGGDHHEGGLEKPAVSVGIVFGCILGLSWVPALIAR